MDERVELESEVRELGERVGRKSGRCKYGVREWEVRERSSLECKSGARVSVRKRGGRAGCENTVCERGRREGVQE